MDTKKQIEDFITPLMREKVTLQNEFEEFKKEQDKQIDEMFCEFLTVIDTFERAEQNIQERGLVGDENAKKAINRLLNAKKKALFVLEKYNIKKIEFEDNHSKEELCEIVDTEPDPTKETGEIVSIEKQGYTRAGHLLRPAEVIIVKN
jgi:molecular chaperone GrpE (heat shock protein)